MEVVKVFDYKFQNLAQCEPRILEYIDCSEAPLTSETEPNIAPEAEPSADKTTLSCSNCKVQFANVAQQREHYKLDWHRYNLQRKLNGQPTVTETEFEEKDEVSSISGSESESEESSETRSSTYIGQSQGRVCIAANDGHVYSLHRCLLADKKQEIINVKESLHKLKNNMWFVILLGGGHFAAAIFEGDTILRHKTFHCYTVRAGQGGSQSARDNKNGGSGPKSAGASLRRYNEQALAGHVTTILETWKDDIARCTIIPFRAAGPHNKTMLFGGKTPIIQRGDQRLRVIPFATRRATFKEVKRVHDVLASVTIYESVESLQKEVTSPDEKGERKRNKSRGGSINRAKSRDNPEPPLPCALVDESGNVSSDCEEIIEKFESLEVSFTDTLKAFEDTLTPADRRRKVKKPKSTENMRLHLERQAKIKADKERQKIERHLRTDMYQSIITTNLVTFVELLKSDATAVNLPLDPDGNTALHICADMKKHDFIEALLESGADVCLKNVKNQTPYTATQDKQTREIFKQFAEDNPDKFNYNRAQIPVPPKLTEEELELKKLKVAQQKKAKRERAKEIKKQKILTQEEEDEKHRFALLSDREKHALAAERRILNAHGTITSRCFECGNDIGGKVPFQYSNNQFCSIACLKAHRMKHPSDLPF